MLKDLDKVSWSGVTTDTVNVQPEVPGSLVSEPKRQDSRFKSRLGTGLGFESQTFQVSESEPESKFWLQILFIQLLLFLPFKKCKKYLFCYRNGP